MTLCANCKTREGSLTWVGEGGAWAYIHGGGALWCEQCVLEAQVEYAEKIAALLPERKRRLIELKGGTIL